MREDITSPVSRAFQVIAPAIAAIALTGCDAKLDVDAPAPAMMADMDTLPPLPTSTLDIPLTYDLTPVVREVEKAVPKKFGNLAERKQLSNKRIHVAYEARREPFAVSLTGQTAHIASVVHYKGRGWYDPPLAPEISSSCGVNDAEPRARIALAADLRITRDWKLRSRTRVSAVQPYTDQTRDQCRVTPLKIDVTQRVLNATRGALEEQRPMIDRKIASLDIRKRFESWWHLLERPIPLADSVWL
ncbi:MAG TPA: DUF4403 family protein, partial [Gemmatimonadaceae bacterium]|nr:DUF4403 family protein [Gemmatimonadaceae bacterium]